MKQQTLPLSILFFALFAVALLSCWSGFHTFPVPPELAFQFSPLGLLQGVTPENRELQSVAYFSGLFGNNWDYLVVFLKTCLYEFPLYWLCFRRLRMLQILAVLVTANVLTHPVVFFMIPRFFETYLKSALTSEFFAASAEMLLAAILLNHWKDHFSKRERYFGPLLILAANLFSWELGMFL